MEERCPSNETDVSSRLVSETSTDGKTESTTRAGKHGDDDDDDGDSGVDACEIERDGYEYASGGDVYGDALSRCVFWMERC